MPTSKELPFILQLLEDDSSSVQQSLSRELAAFGDSLGEELLRLSPPPSMGQRIHIQNLLRDQSRQWLKDSWVSWLEGKADIVHLEMALNLIARFQSRFIYRETLANLLDELAEEFRRTQTFYDPCQLAEFLFKTKDLKGAREDYYNPLNSNLVYVIKEKQGLPISLVCIYMLVGRRLGFHIEG